MDNIEIRGAKTHNLKNITVTIPRNKLVVITGPSGSGKSSLAFDTLYAEGQRRYVESLSAYARQFLSMMEKPDVESISGLSPAISIEQKATSHNPRSTVGTITEVYDYLRLLYARVGIPHCPTHNKPLQAQTISQIVEQVLLQPNDTKLIILAPVVRGRKGVYLDLFHKLQSEGFVRVRIDGENYELDNLPELDKNKKHDIEVVIDRIKINPDARVRITDSLNTASALADGIVSLLFTTNSEEKQVTLSTKHACSICGYSIAELEPKIFSFNNPHGACPTCEGLGTKQFFDPESIVNENLSVAAGAINNWGRRNSYYFSLLESLAAYYDFDIDMPYKKLSKKIKNIILYGSDDEIEFTYITDKGHSYQRTKCFEGVIPTMERRYRETESNIVREELTKYLSNQKCPDCDGTRLNEAARHVKIDSYTLPKVAALSIADAYKFCEELQLTGNRAQIAEKIIKEISERLKFLVDVGLDYVSLDRSANTLSGGEAQRIRLASQIGSGLVGVTYVLDEPSIGLHQRDNTRLLNTLIHLRDIGNTVVVIEHDEEAMLTSDHIIDIGPGAGINGGTVVAYGTPKQIQKHDDSITGKYLSKKLQIEVPEKRTTPDDKWIIINQAEQNNLKSVDVKIPVGIFTCITGVSGSGKSTLINDTLYPVCAKQLNKATHVNPGKHKNIENLHYLDKVIDINQSPIGRTPRSNPATYTGMFTNIRDLFAATNEARSRGYAPGRFSFNVKGGRCEACQGDGLIKVEMHFLADVFVICDVCKGKRYNQETLEIKYKGKNIHEVLNLTVDDASEFFKNIPAVMNKLNTLQDVGLGYITLGQSATTLSGGEAQRIKLAKELSKRDTGRTLYILDEPTTGLHFQDVQQLLQVLFKLKQRGNTVIVIEHNLDVIKTADWIIDLGPEGGNNGGTIVAVGSPEDIAKNKKSHTGKYLKAML